MINFEKSAAEFCSALYVVSDKKQERCVAIGRID